MKQANNVAISDIQTSQNFALETNTNNNNSSKLLERTPIENTPFWLIGNEETGYQIAYGKYALTSKYPTKEETLKILKEQPYTVTAVMCGVIAQYTIENNQK